MKRLKDGYLEVVESVVPLAGKEVLEIGCGNGSRSVQIAARCKKLIAVEPDAARIADARTMNARENVEYRQGSAYPLVFPDRSFDIIFYTLSFHHVPIREMSAAIDEAIRVVKLDGHIIFFEPTFEGSFFEAELVFESSDGDERKEKAYAYYSILSHPNLVKIAELFDETIFQFDSVDDFIASTHPKKEINQIASFLESRQYMLAANRRINICTPRFS